MADGSCSAPSAFKGLARHIEQDRSLQQDRVAPGPQHQAQIFRSTPLNANLPDQFGAFQQQNAALPQHLLVGWNNYSHSAQTTNLFPQQPTQQPPNFATNAGASWVSDFERMSFTNTSSNPMNAYPTTNGGMMRQPSTSGPMRYHSALHHQALTAMPPYTQGLHPLNHQPGSSRTVTKVPLLALDIQAEAMLEQEFEDAMNDWMLQNGPGAEAGDQDELVVQESETPTANLDATEEDLAETQDDLARAAQQLVDSVADNNSEKFKNSDFLALMRRIASQEVVVQGNDLVETQSDSHSESQPTIPAMATNRDSSMASDTRILDTN
ncbi:hypothetical protein RRF57_002191 [Xylaria bambusicola]|uniref:Peroxin 20 n=1 Tax=Xylaria bambusicola TaxID=326684 RepID=A0AAN7UID5_9PEZI